MPFIKQLSYILLPLVLLTTGCNNSPQGTKKALPQDTLAMVSKDALATNNTTLTDTLQYLTDGENEDNTYSLFTNSQSDTISIVWEKPSANLKNGAMFLCSWEVTQVTSGGDDAIKYPQAFMTSFRQLDLKPFTDPSINAQKRRLNYLFFANGGLIGYLNDGTIVGCPRCDPNAGNVESMLKKPSMGTYRVQKDGGLKVDGKETVYPRVTKDINEWIIFKTDAQWDAYINDIDDLSSDRNQQYLVGFINGYITQLKKQSPSAMRIWILSNPNITEAFKVAYKKLIETNPAPDYDFVLDAQDVPEQSLEINSFHEEDRNFWLAPKNSTTPVLMAHLKLVGGKWLVDGCGAVNIPKEKRVQK